MTPFKTPPETCHRGGLIVSMPPRLGAEAMHRVTTTVIEVAFDPGLMVLWGSYTAASNDLCDSLRELAEGLLFRPLELHLGEQYMSFFGPDRRLRVPIDEKILSHRSLLILQVLRRAASALFDAPRLAVVGGRILHTGYRDARGFSRRFPRRRLFLTFVAKGLHVSLSQSRSNFLNFVLAAQAAIGQILCGEHFGKGGSKTDDALRAWLLRLHGDITTMASALYAQTVARRIPPPEPPLAIEATPTSSTPSRSGTSPSP